MKGEIGCGLKWQVLSLSVALLEAPCHSFVIQQLKFPADVCVVCA